MDILNTSDDINIDIDTDNNLYGSPSRWSQYEADAIREQEAATAQAVYSASKAMAENQDIYDYTMERTGSAVSRGSAFEDEDMVEVASVASSSGTDNDAYYNAVKNHDKGTSSTTTASSSGNSFVVDHATIRQEALRMLEVADADRHYHIHRTLTGGYTATPKSKRPASRAALSGINLSTTTGRRDVGKSYRDNPFSNTYTAHAPDYDDDEDNVVDVVGMERRSLANHTEETNKSPSCWSSRYSIDSTLLAMTGGTVSHQKVTSMRNGENDPYSRTNAKILDRMDRESRNTNTNTTGVFGSAAALQYRLSNVFGKQNVTLPSTNLQSAFVEQGEASLPLANPRSKTWQEQLHQQARNRRLVLLLGLFVVLILIVVPTSVVVTRRKKQLGGGQSVAFYAIANTPWFANDENKLAQDLKSLSTDQAKFVVHLGNIQNAASTKCPQSHYEQVAQVFQRNSPLSMFVVPGSEDWSNCPQPKDAWHEWYTAFGFFNQKFDENENMELDTFYQEGQLENWAILESGVLFVGVHAVTHQGTLDDWTQTQLEARNARNYEWVMGMAEKHRSDIRSMVIFGNARPGTSQTLSFFAPLSTFLIRDKFANLPVLYVHAPITPSVPAAPADGLYPPFRNVPNLKAVEIQPGSKSAPVRINVGYGSDPFILG